MAIVTREEERERLKAQPLSLSWSLLASAMLYKNKIKVFHLFATLTSKVLWTSKRNGFDRGRRLSPWADSPTDLNCTWRHLVQGKVAYGFQGLTWQSHLPSRVHADCQRAGCPQPLQLNKVKAKEEGEGRGSEGERRKKVKEKAEGWARRKEWRVRSYWVSRGAEKPDSSSGPTYHLEVLIPTPPLTLQFSELVSKGALTIHGHFSKTTGEVRGTRNISICKLQRAPWR